MTILNDTDRGTLSNEGNETFQDSKIPDASKFRVGAPYEAGQSGGGGALSFDVLNLGGRSRTEVAVLVGSYNGQQGEVGLSIWNGQEPFDDTTQQKIVEFFGDHVEFKVPVSAPNLQGTGANVLTSAGGQYRLYLQGDGNLVVYRVANGQLTAVWSIFTGLIP